MGKDWQKHPGCSIPELQQLSPVCICYHVGATSDHIGVDIDGPEAIAFLRGHGVDPLTANTWRIVRTSTADRLKLVFRVTPEQKAELAAGRKKVRVGQAEGNHGAPLELFASHGKQIVVLGNHHDKSGQHDDQYAWDGRLPAEAQPLPDAWMEILRGVFCGSQPLLPRPATSSNGNGHRPTTLAVPVPPSGHWDDTAKARAALAQLNVLDFADHDDWVRVGMALHSVGDPALLDDWDQWSAGDPSKYTPGECQKRWRSFNGGGAVTLGTLVHWAWGDGPKPWTTPQLQRAATDNWIPAVAPLRNGRAPQPTSNSADGGSQPPLTYRELLELALQATRDGDEDLEMATRAGIMGRFRRTDGQITAALFCLLTAQELGMKQQRRPTCRSIDLSVVEGLDWLVDGFIPKNDMAIVDAPMGGGKTLAALGMAFSVIDGSGFLDRSGASEQGKVLFIASDSGASPLRRALEDLDLMTHPAHATDGRRFHVWAAEKSQDAAAWDTSLTKCLQMLRFVREERIVLVVIDSCKAVTSRADVNYTDNQQVTALLTFFKEVVCPHCSILWINHDGTAFGATAGAKSWREIPSVCHSIERVKTDREANGQFREAVERDDVRGWVVRKSRLGAERRFQYTLDRDRGVLEVLPDVEIVGDCRMAILDVLTTAWRNGVESLTRTELINEVFARHQHSSHTVENTLTKLTGGRAPAVTRPRRGVYALAPRLRQAADAELQEEPAGGGSRKGSMLDGREKGKNTLVDNDLSISRQSPAGETQHSAILPREKHGRSGKASGDSGSREIPPQGHGLSRAQGVPAPWLLALLALRDADPDAHPATLVLGLPEQWGDITGRDAAAALDAWDAQQEAV